MGSNLLRQLKDVIHDFVDDDKNILDVPKRIVIRKEISDERVELLRQFIDLLLNTRFITEETKLYISNRYITNRGVFDKLRQRDPDINLNTVKSKIYYDKNKIISNFGGRFLVEVIEYVDIDIASYRDKIADLMSRYCESNILGNVRLELPVVQLKEYATDDQFNEFISTVMPYTKRIMDEIAEGIDMDTLGYVRFLLTSTLLNEEDKQRKARLIKLLE